MVIILDSCLDSRTKNSLISSISDLSCDLRSSLALLSLHSMIEEDDDEDVLENSIEDLPDEEVLSDEESDDSSDSEN